MGLTVIVLLLSASSSEAILSRFFNFWTPFVSYTQGNGQTIHNAYYKLIQYCSHPLVPGAKHPFGIIGRTAFEQAYKQWTDSIYHRMTSLQLHHRFGTKQAIYWSTWTIHPECERYRDLTPQIEAPLPNLMSLLRLYATKEAQICRDVAGMLAHFDESAVAKFNVTDNVIKITPKAHPLPWHPVYMSDLYHASVFSTLFAPVVLTLILLIRHPRVFAFFFR
ncbi:ORF2a' protein [Kafue kinda chacma baboon virus]|uniref:ORF2a' protein n=1 Tax=Kafue kinda chacma baboon virus TaxID=1823757 RepID=A0A0Y0BBM4_9NIDO|nr:ORF2a' protein [Kafue kinda chacma baboon virus]AMB20711.1 ORF2a' protein [Kafue kinda chacma baboon virus]AMV49334.1 ORF2a' protein [Kafue kinda chacma baboon virus]